MKWIKSKFPGIRYREHPSRKHGVAPDKYISIRYKLKGKDHEEALGWMSEGWTFQRASERLAELRANQRTGDGPQTLREKRAEREAKKAREDANQAKEKAERITLDEFMAIYLDWAKTNKRHWSNDEYRYRLHIQPDLGAKPMRDITPFAIERLKKRLTEAGLSPATIKHCLCIIRQLFNKAVFWGKYNGVNPIKKVTMPKLNNAKLRTLTLEEEALLFKELAKRSQTVHDQALIALYAGLRFEEIANMQWQDVNLEDRLLIVRGKGGKIRTVPLCDKLVAMFQTIGPGRTTETVFPSNQKTLVKKVSHTFWRAVESTGLNQDQDRRFRVDFHCLRHTFATRLAGNGTPLNVLRDLLGHADFQMVSRYSHVSPGLAMAAVNGLDQGDTNGMVLDLNRANSPR